MASLHVVRKDEDPAKVVRDLVNDLGLSEAARWLGVHQKYAIDDSARMNRIEERLDRLERPWWKRLFGWRSRLFGRSW